MRPLSERIAREYLALSVAWVLAVFALLLILTSTARAETRSRALAQSTTCQTPTSWIVTTDDGLTWEAQCGDAEGRAVCHPQWDNPSCDPRATFAAQEASLDSWNDARRVIYQRPLTSTPREVRALTAQARRDRRRSLDAWVRHQASGARTPPLPHKVLGARSGRP